LVLVPAAGVLGLNLVLQEGLRGLGRPYAVLQAELAGLAVTAVALVALLYPMGILGAAIASLLGYSTVTVVLLLGARRYAGMSPGSLLFLTGSELQRAFAALTALAQGAMTGAN
jgi:O-antigen/teichoic acid export membrane protein